MTHPPRFQLKRYLLRLYLAAFVVFVANKFWLRPVVLAHDFGFLKIELLKIIVLSLPNTIEAIFGVTNIACLLHFAKHRFKPRLDGLQDTALYLLALGLAGVYVLTQEFKIHNLGGRNTYDPYDVVASIIGLLGTWLVVARFGVVESPAPAAH